MIFERDYFRLGDYTTGRMETKACHLMIKRKLLPFIRPRRSYFRRGVGSLFPCLRWLSNRRLLCWHKSQ